MAHTRFFKENRLEWFPMCSWKDEAVIATDPTTAFLEKFEKAKKKIIASYPHGVPACTSTQLANYQLDFPLPPFARGFKGICYYAQNNKLDLNRFAKMMSENCDGMFNPLTLAQYISFQKTLSELQRMGVTIKSCEENFSLNSFYRNTGYYKVIVSSFKKNARCKIINKETYGDSQYLKLQVDKQSIYYNFFGMREDINDVAVFVHEFGHVLNLNHFPPNLASSYNPACITQDFLEKFDAVSVALNKYRCAAEDFGKHHPQHKSIMFCSYVLSPKNNDYKLTEGDGLAFKKSYDFLTSGNYEELESNTFLGKANFLQPNTFNQNKMVQFLESFLSIIHDFFLYLTSYEMRYFIASSIQSIAISFITSYVTCLISVPEKYHQIGLFNSGAAPNCTAPMSEEKFQCTI